MQTACQTARRAIGWKCRFVRNVTGDTEHVYAYRKYKYYSMYSYCEYIGSDSV